jgi:hypothetical protein
LLENQKELETVKNEKLKEIDKAKKAQVTYEAKIKDLEA